MSPPPHAFLAETHTAVILGLGDRVFKLRKPVDLGFLDQRSLEQRQTACRREVELNRRFSPDVYLGVGELASPEPDRPPEPVVVMRRLPDRYRLAELARTGSDLHDEMRRIAHLVAGYHAVAPSPPAAEVAASPDTTRQRWETNAREMEPFVGRFLDRDVFDAVRRGADRYLAGRTELLQARIDGGWARDGHGDLLAEDIFCLEDGPRILDCLDFDERLRVGDVLADAAFLAMDLHRLGRPELGWTFLHAHAELLGDSWPVSLARHHIAYRAQVRAKVSCIRADQGDDGAASAGADLLDLCRGQLDAATVRLVLVGGPPGSGKSTLAEALGERLGAVALSADPIRKELAGLDATDVAAAELDHGIYDGAHTHATYEELLHRAGALLGMGETVVLDASWHDATRRAAARALAERSSAVPVELACVVPEAVAAARIERRRATSAPASDADPRIARLLRERTSPWPEAVTIDTNASPEDSVTAALAAVTARH